MMRRNLLITLCGLVLLGLLCSQACAEWETGLVPDFRTHCSLNGIWVANNCEYTYTQPICSDLAVTFTLSGEDMDLYNDPISDEDREVHGTIYVYKKVSGQWSATPLGGTTWSRTIDRYGNVSTTGSSVFIFNASQMDAQNPTGEYKIQWKAWDCGKHLENAYSGGAVVSYPEAIDWPESDPGHGEFYLTVASSVTLSAPVVTDDGDITSSTSQLHATWSAVPGAIFYQYAVDTNSSPEGDGNWSSSITDTEATASGLNLTPGATYYFHVKALMGGCAVSYGVSDGIECGSGNIVYVKTTGSDGNDGSTWSLAKATPQGGVDAASSGDEVWVAGGTYTDGNITLKDGVSVYGGFAGTETLRSQRDPETNVTTLSVYNQAVTAADTISSMTVVDGFTMTTYGWPSASFAIYNQGSPVISNNVLTGWRATYGPYTVFTSGGSPTFVSNKIIDNSASGIYISDGSPKIIDNIISGNTSRGIYVSSWDTGIEIVNNVITNNGTQSSYGGGIYVEDQTSPTITNNTIVGNVDRYYGGGGIYVQDTAAPVIKNNIIAFNTTSGEGGGIYVEGQGVTVDYNDVYGNTANTPAYNNYYGISAGANDISVDPEFYDADNDDYHLTLDSDCIDAGLDTASAIQNTDLDGRPRILGDDVDMGAYEYQRLHVKTTGDDSNDGSSWTLAKKTVKAAVEQSRVGDEIWVAGGVYNETEIKVKSGIKLTGGYAGTGTTRDISTYETVLDGYLTGRIVVLSSNASNQTLVDGFTIQNAKMQTTGGVYGGAVYASGYATVSNNIIQMNDGLIGPYSGAVMCYGGCPTISGNSILGNDSYGVSVSYGSAKIIGNYIAWNYNTGITLLSGEDVEIVNNVVASNNTEDTTYGTRVMTGGIGVTSSTGTIITNNTVAQNIGNYLSAGGILIDGGSATIKNNVVAFNHETNFSPGGIWIKSGTATQDYNNVWGNTSQDHTQDNYAGTWGWMNFNRGYNSISADPMFVDMYNGDYRLLDGSPCINAGSNSAPSVPSVDIDGVSRPYDTTVDIGAYETESRPMVIAVDPENNDTGVSVSSVVTATFSKAMDTSTINANTFTLKDSGNNPVAGTVTYDSATKTATFAPDYPYLLETSETYTARILGSVCDDQDYSLGADYTWSFSTSSDGMYVYVNPSAQGTPHDGSSWNNAFLTIGDALNSVSGGEVIRVAAGTYWEKITLVSGVKLLGGYLGTGTTRDPGLYETVIDGTESGTVVTIPSQTTNRTMIDGFTIQNGTSNGGIACSGSAVISGNVIRANGTTSLVSGIKLLSGSSDVTIRDNVIKDNTLLGIDGMSGGSAKIIGNLISNNGEGGIYSGGSSDEIINNVIAANGMDAEYGGGGIQVGSYANAVIAHNTIVGNNGGTYGAGGIRIYYNSGGSITNNIVAFNTNTDIYPGGINASGCSFIADYNDVYGNTNVNGSSDVDIWMSYHDWGENNISVDPLFFDMDNNDYHLTFDSGCIDSGINAVKAVWDIQTPPPYIVYSGSLELDKDGRTRIIDGDEDSTATADMGAYEYRKLCVSFHGDDSRSGLTWSTAKRNVAAALAIATAGDEIWVGSGYFYTNVTMKSGVKLLGGFSGVGSTRDPVFTHSNLYGSNGGTVITIPAGTNKYTVVDGCTISDGYSTSAGGGIHAEGAVTISNNTVSGNESTSNGSGILVAGKNVVIRSNTVTDNTGDGICLSGYNATVVGNYIGENTIGIDVLAGDANTVIANNMIANNDNSSGYGAGGISIGGFMGPTVTNNTIVGNIGGGVSCNTWCYSAIKNNIIAYNDSQDNDGGGVTVYTSSNVVLDYNNVYGNTSTDPTRNNYWLATSSPGANSISADPVFYDLARGDCHLTISSPCIDTGLNTAGGVQSIDKDGRTRIIDGDSNGTATVDMGAYEYRKLCVSTSGDGGYNGLTWGTAKSSVTEAMSVAVEGDEIWVSEGTYYGNFTLKQGVKLLGGFSGSDTTRDPAEYETILDGNASGTVVTVSSGNNPTTTLDGFTIRNGYGTSAGGGVHADGTCTISNNKVTDNDSSSNGSGIFSKGMDMLIRSNVVTSNDGEGIFVNGGTALVDSNYIDENRVGIHVAGGTSTTKIVNNVIVNNDNDGGWGAGGLMVNGFTNPDVTNNTIVGNLGGGVYLNSPYGNPVMKNNIVAFNSTSSTNAGGIHGYGVSPELDYNNVYGNTSSEPTRNNYYVSVSTGANSISVDPQFYDTEIGDYHLTFNSGCIDTGLNTASSIQPHDKDGRTRIIDGDEDTTATVDIGAYEYRKLCVSTSGDDIDDGLTWATAKESIEGALAAAECGDEIWVAQGTYAECVTMKSGVKLLGGYYGSGTTRDIATYTTTLDANDTGSVVTIPAGSTLATVVDGFTITDGNGTGTGTTFGGGVYCLGSAMISNNIITDNQAGFGDGVCLSGGSPVLKGNTVTQNASGGCGVMIYNGSPKVIGNYIIDSSGMGVYVWSDDTGIEIVNNLIAGNNNGSGYGGGGLQCGSYTSPVIVNNTIVDNTGGQYGGGGIRVDQQASPTIKNNIVAFNSDSYGYAGGINAYGTAAVLDYNDVYGNTSSEPSRNNYWLDGGNTPGANSISSDPLFVDRQNGDYHITSNSPCVDAGNNTAPAVPVYDIDGDARPNGDYVDIGADEY